MAQSLEVGAWGCEERSESWSMEDSRPGLGGPRRRRSHRRRE